MFNILDVAKKIRNARVNKNMTQMDLADAMGVSYQAVSNWERGNSMPDISKIPELCRILDIGYDELLNSDSSSACAIKKVIENDQENITVEELNEIASIMEPKNFEQIADKKIIIKSKNHNNQKELSSVNRDSLVEEDFDSGEEKFNFDKENYGSDMENFDSKESKIDIHLLMDMAPFLDTKYLDQKVENIEDNFNLKELCGLAPFLSQITLDKLVNKFFTGNINDIVCLAPFLGFDCLNNIANQCNSSRDLLKLAPFLAIETLHNLLKRFNSPKDVVRLAPFLSREDIDNIAYSYESSKDLYKIAPFVSNEALDKIVDKFDNMKDITRLAPFLSKETLNRILDKKIHSKDENDN